MPITFKPDGSVVCDTVEEALAMSRVIGPDRRAAKAAETMQLLSGGDVVRARRPDHSPADLVAVIRQLQPNQKTVFDLLIKHGSVTFADLQKTLSIETNNGIAAVFAAITKNLTSAGYEPTAVITRKHDEDQGDYVATAGPLLAELRASLKEKK